MQRKRCVLSHPQSKRTSFPKRLVQTYLVVTLQAAGASTAAAVAEVAAAVAALQAQRAAQAQRLAALEAAAAAAAARACPAAQQAIVEAAASCGGLPTGSAAGEAAAGRGRPASPDGAAARAHMPALQGALGAVAERAGAAAPPAAEAAPERECPHAAGAAAEPQLDQAPPSASAESDGATGELEAAAQVELGPEAATGHRHPSPPEPATVSGRAPAPCCCHALDAAAAHVLAGAEARDSNQAPARPGAAGHALAAEQETAERQRRSALEAAPGRKHPPVPEAAQEWQCKPVLEAAAERRGGCPERSSLGERTAAPLEAPGTPNLTCSG
jgi:hypothetical protein